MTEQELIKKYLGIPYKHLGRTMEGLDCYGFNILAYRDLGFELFDIEYERNWASKGKNYMLENYYRQWEPLKKPIMLFDVVTFKRDKDSEMVSHAGLILTDNRFIHCCRQGVLVSRLSDGSWLELLDDYYHLKERI